MNNQNQIIDDLINNELDRANTKFPPFASRHEAWAVLKEEVEEAGEDVTMITRKMGNLWECARFGCEKEEAAHHINAIEKFAIAAIGELIQVAAMCRKSKKLEGAE